MGRLFAIEIIYRGIFQKTEFHPRVREDMLFS